MTPQDTETRTTQYLDSRPACECGHIVLRDGDEAVIHFYEHLLEKHNPGWGRVKYLVEKIRGLKNARLLRHRHFS